MKHNVKMMAAVLGGAAEVTLGGLGTTLVEGPAGPASAAPAEMTMGATSTETTPPATPAVVEAAPKIKGPAPLPSEEQGLP